MKLLSKKGGIAPYMLTWIVFTTLMMVIIFGFLLFFLDKALNPPSAIFPGESAMLSNALLFSANGLAYQDPITGRAITGVIDLDKLRDESFREELLKTVNYGEGQEYIAAKIKTPSSTTFYNEKAYFLLEPKVDSKGPGSTIKTEHQYRMLYADKGKIKPVHILVSVEVLRLRGNEDES
jgi:hypothetical protein